MYCIHWATLDHPPFLTTVNKNKISIGNDVFYIQYVLRRIFKQEMSDKTNLSVTKNNS